MVHRISTPQVTPLATLWDALYSALGASGVGLLVKVFPGRVLSVGLVAAFSLQYEILCWADQFVRIFDIVESASLATHANKLRVFSRCW